MIGTRREKKKLKKNTFFDYIACANHLIEQRYTYKGGYVFMEVVLEDLQEERC